MKKAKIFTLLFATAVSSAIAQDGGSSLFGGKKNYRTWSIGLNTGAMAPYVFLGGHNDYNSNNFQLGYGAYIQKQITHAFALKLDYQGGSLSGKYKVGANANNNGDQSYPGYSRFDTKVNYAASLQAQVDLTSLLLKRNSRVALYVQGGWGITSFKPDGRTRKEQFIPVGGGLKVKLMEGINLDLGYTMNFLDADNLDRTWFGPSNDKWSYGYAGLSFALGSRSKKNLDWVNPYAVMYDELKDNKLQAEIDNLKSRVSTTEGDISKVKNDGDKDGVSDIFDKEASTPAGNVVDGAGRTIVFPKQEVAPPVHEKVSKWNADFKNILFDNGKATIHPQSLSILEKAAKEMVEYPQYKFHVDGHTDNVGNAKFNKTLSHERAEAVAKTLIQHGVSADRLNVRGFGSEKPKCTNKTAEGKACNRRVEITLQ